MTYDDEHCSADQLDAKYNPDGDGEHPVHTRWDWRQAVAQAAKILKDHMYIFIDFDEEPERSDRDDDRDLSSINENLNKSVEELELSVRSYNCLKRAGINTVQELIQRNEDEMMKVRNLGRKSLEEVQQKLSALGLGLRQDD